MEWLEDKSIPQQTVCLVRDGRCRFMTIKDIAQESTLGWKDGEELNEQYMPDAIGMSLRVSIRRTLRKKPVLIWSV